MSDKVFIDSNVWLYSLIETQQENDQFKHRLAKKLIYAQTNIQISTQVVNEVCVNLMRKANQDNDYLFQFLRTFIAAYHVHEQTPDDLLTAAGLRLEFKLSFWDSLIVASAINSQCTSLYSEDMQDGLVIYDDLQIINPFI